MESVALMYSISEALILLCSYVFNNYPEFASNTIMHDILPKLNDLFFQLAGNPELSSIVENCFIYPLQKLNEQILTNMSSFKIIDYLKVL
jgi:hypothetical protein